MNTKQKSPEKTQINKNNKNHYVNKKVPQKIRNPRPKGTGSDPCMIYASGTASAGRVPAPPAGRNSY